MKNTNRTPGASNKQTNPSKVKAKGKSIGKARNSLASAQLYPMKGKC